MPYKDLKKKREYQLQWMAKRRKIWFNENGPCKNCGSTDDLEVDHINPETKITHNFWSWSFKRMKEELKKCQVLCTKCHLEKTKLQLINPPAHGTANRYKSTKYACRCSLCTEAHKIRQRYYRKNIAA